MIIRILGAFLAGSTIAAHPLLSRPYSYVKPESTGTQLTAATLATYSMYQWATRSTFHEACMKQIDPYCMRYICAASAGVSVTSICNVLGVGCKNRWSYLCGILGYITTKSVYESIAIDRCTFNTAILRTTCSQPMCVWHKCDQDGRYQQWRYCSREGDYYNPQTGWYYYPENDFYYRADQDVVSGSHVFSLWYCPAIDCYYYPDSQRYYYPRSNVWTSGQEIDYQQNLSPWYYCMIEIAKMKQHKAFGAATQNAVKQQIMKDTTLPYTLRVQASEIVEKEFSEQDNMRTYAIKYVET